MADFYGRGLATGSWIGQMVNPQSTGREAYLQATHEQMALDKLSAGGYGTAFQDGRWILTDEGLKTYANSPLHARQALMAAPKNADEAHKRALEVSKAGLGMMEEVDKRITSQMKQYEEMYSNDPQKLAEARKTLDFMYYKAMTQYLPDVMKTAATQEIIARHNNMDSSELAQEVFKGNLMSYIDQMSKPGYQPRFKDLTVIEQAFNGLSKDNQKIFLPTMTELRKVKPLEIASAEAQAEEFKKEQMFPGEMARKRKELSQELGMRNSAAIAQEEEKRKRGLGTYGSYRIVQTDQGTFYVPVRPGENGENVVPLKGPEGTVLGKPLPSDQLNKVSDLLTLKDNIKQINDLFNEKYVGPVAGRWYGLGEKVVNLPEDQVMFYSYVRDNKDALLRARSGAQINEQEYKRLVAFLPDENLPPKNFKARQKRFEQEVDTILKNKMKMLKSGGYGTSGIKTDVETPSPQNRSNQQRFKILKVE